MEIGNVCGKFLLKSDNLDNTVINGYASVFNVIDSQNDSIEKGAFENISSDNIKFLWQHDSAKPIGIIKTIHEDNYGLKFEAEINNKTICGKEASELVKQKAVDGLSIGFYAKDFEYDNQGIRLIKKIDLMEISIVTFPANRSASITDVKTQNNELIEQSLEKLFLLVQKLTNLK